MSLPARALDLLRALADDAPAHVVEEQALALVGDDPQDGQTARALAVRIKDLLDSRRRRESELAALVDTARELATTSDPGGVLDAIVRRARSLLGTDTAYLTLYDPEVGDTLMRATAGSVSAAFQQVRLPLGAGLGGLVAQTRQALVDRRLPARPAVPPHRRDRLRGGRGGAGRDLRRPPAGRRPVRRRAVRVRPGAARLRRRRGRPAQQPGRAGRGLAGAGAGARRGAVVVGQHLPGRRGARPVRRRGARGRRRRGRRGGAARPARRLGRGARRRRPAHLGPRRRARGR